MDRICCIISAGDVNQALLKKNKSSYDYFIAADAGFEKAMEASITPSLLIGDFDSISQEVCIPNTTKVISHPVEKDLSDTHLAIEEGMKLGYTHFHVYGALGGDRFSHSLSNLQTLCAMKKKHVSVTLIGDKEIIYLLQNESLTLSQPPHTGFSVFSLSNETKNVTITGAKYNLENATLTNAYPLGLSNQSIENNVLITAGNGYLLIVSELSEI